MTTLAEDAPTHQHLDASHIKKQCWRKSSCLIRMDVIFSNRIFYLE
jgi:hypothetical protein